MFKKIIAKTASTLVAVAVAFSGVSVFSATKASAYDYLNMDLFDVMSGNFGMFEDVLGDYSDSAYDLDINIKLAEEGNETKPFDISALVTQKDNKAAVDMDVKYDGKHAMSISRITDEQTGTQYIKIPELNSACFSGDEYDNFMFSMLLSMMLSPGKDMDYKEYLDSLYGDDNESDEEDSEIDDETDDGSDDESYGEDIDIEGWLEVLESIDEEALMADLQGYFDLLDGQFVPVEIKSETETIGDRDFVIDSNIYNITVQDVVNAINDIADKLKADAFLKDIVAQLGFDENEYIQFIDEILAEINDMQPSELAVQFTLTVCMNEGNIVGVGFDDEETATRSIMISDGDYYGFKTFTNTDYMKSTTNGYAIIDGDIINGSIVEKTEYFEDGNYSSETKTTWENVNISRPDLSGKHTTVTEEIDEYGEVDRYSELFESNGDENNIDIKFVITENDIVTKSVTITGEKVEPADIILPTENVYSLTNADDAVAYIESADVTGFLRNMKNVLGDELFNYYFGEMELEDPKADPESPIESVVSKDDKPESKPAETTKPVTNKKPVTTVVNSTTNNGGNSPETGAKGLTLTIVALAGLAFVVTKKK
ncbi:MAG: NPXTG-anchored protein [Ruminococcus sp.]|nr:NPXTG-anchored protein [Ruminococcus sp.]